MSLSAIQQTPIARRYSFRYSSPTPGSYLIVKWWDAAGGNITINAATLTYGPNHLQIKPVSGGQMQVTWPIGTLLEAPAITGPWTTNSHLRLIRSRPQARKNTSALLLNNAGSLLGNRHEW